MNHYITGKIIKELREKRKLTQLELATRLNVSDKTISKWETGKGYPDISLIEPLSKALGVSVIELMNGEYIVNRNTSSNMMHSKFSVCPLWEYHPYHGRKLDFLLWDRFAYIGSRRNQ